MGQAWRGKTVSLCGSFHFFEHDWTRLGTIEDDGKSEDRDPNSERGPKAEARSGREASGERFAPGEIVDA
jgi:hypothetical protein